MESKETIPAINWKNIVLPVLLGIGLSLYLILSTIKPQQLFDLPVSGRFYLGLLLAFLTVIARDSAYIYRIREITGRKLSWWKSFEVIMLWEFGSAVTPGAVGGIALALFILKKEGISYGRSTATIMLTTFLDNLAFVLVFTLLFFTVGSQMFFVPANCADLKGNALLQSVSYVAGKAWIGYAILFGASLFLGVALFIVPHRAKGFFHGLASFRFLQRFSKPLLNLGDEIEITSNEFKNLSALFYLRVFGATVVSWVSRYLLANALIFAFSNLPLNQLEVLARQYVIWVFIIIPSTPGASGIAEIFFQVFNCPFIPEGLGLSAKAAFIWRLYSYYLYLVIGAIVLPKWISRVNRNAATSNS